MNQADYQISDSTPIVLLTVGQIKSLFRSFIPTTQESNDSIPELFGKEVCSQFTGFSVNTLNKFISERKIPHYKRGSKVLFKRIEIESWLLENRIKTVDEFLSEKDKEFTSLKCR